MTLLCSLFLKFTDWHDSINIGRYHSRIHTII